MSAAIESGTLPQARARTGTSTGIALPAMLAVGFLVGTAVCAVFAPIWLSIVAVFVFAGPHNWFEARYFLARLPGRWGRSRSFFTLAIGGAVTLTGLYLSMGPVARAFEVGDAGAGTIISVWATLAVAWLVSIAAVVGGQLRRDWTWAVPVGFLVIAFAWWAPGVWWLGLVYGHPLVALLFLDRELRRRPALRTTMRWIAATIPVALVAIWLASAQGSPLAAVDSVTMRIADHAGATILPALPARLLIATHAFLETMHYGVWVIAMPLVGFRSAPWSVTGMPLWQRSRATATVVVAVLAIGAALVLALWASFALDYGTTRDVYFSLAMLHVLVEAPFLVRMLAPRGAIRDA